MKQRNFGKEQIKVSEVGLGCWQIGAGWGTVKDDTAKDILRTALDQGITFYDTADVYGDGRSEKLVGEFFRKNREKVFIASKVGRTPDLYPDGYTKEKVKYRIQKSLQRLQLEPLDLVQTHCIPRKMMEDGEIFEWLNDFKKEGLIRNFGASVETMEEAKICMRHPELYSLQIIFNIFRQNPAEEMLDKAKEKQIGIIARVPLASGLLSGKFTKESSFPLNDHRNFNKTGKYFNIGETFAGIPFDQGVELAKETKSFMPEEYTSMSQMALRWVLDHDAISVVIPGASKPEHVKLNASASDLQPLGKEVHEKLYNLYKNKVEPSIQGHY